MKKKIKREREIFNNSAKRNLALNFVLLLMSKQITQLIKALNSQFRALNFAEAFALTLFTISPI